MARLTEQALAAPATPAEAVDGPSGFDPSRVAELKQMAESLRLWMNSVVEQRNDWTARSGVEVDAQDALQCAFRIASTAHRGLNLVADILAQGMSAGTANTEGLGAAPASPVTGDASPLPLSGIAADGQGKRLINASRSRDDGESPGHE